MKAKCDADSPCTRCLAKDLRCDRKQKQMRKPVSHTATPTVGEQAVRQGASPIATDVENIIAGEVTTEEEVEDSIHVQPAQQQVTPSPDTEELSAQQEPLIALIEDGADDSFAEEVSQQPFDSQIWCDMGGISIDSVMEGWIHYDPAIHRDSFADNGGLLGPTIVNLDGSIGPSAHGQNHIRDGNLNAYFQLDRGVETLGTSMEIPEHQAVVQAQDYWSSFRCNPRKDVAACPRTGGVLLGSLGHMPATDGLWGWLDLDFPSPDATRDLLSMPLLENVRDKLSAISQSFLRKALDVHQLDPAAIASTYPSSSTNVSHGFLVLPPVGTLEHFLREYMRIFEPFYTLWPGGVMDANLLINGGNSSASTLLILLMISQGATSDSTNEARRLSGGLTEVCRISLFDTIEKHVSVCHHHVLVHCALLFTIQAAWSGDKWLMDIGKGQRGIYLAVTNPLSLFRTLHLFSYHSDKTSTQIIQNAGLFDAHECVPESLPLFDRVEAEWEIIRMRWLERERMIRYLFNVYSHCNDIATAIPKIEQANSASRLVYTWAILDLELSIFQDLNPLLPIADFDLPLPDNEDMFLANDVSSWQGALRACDKDSRMLTTQPSLRVLFEAFLGDNLTGQRRRDLNQTSLHLLLYPLHSLIHCFCQLRSCVSAGLSPGCFSPVTRRSTDLRMEELYALLQRWLNLFECYSADCSATRSEYDPMKPSMVAILITYHLIALDTVTDFKEMERLAQARLSENTMQQGGSRVVQKCVQDDRKAVFHAGRILYLLRGLPKKSRPPWWPAAVYRITIILWATSVLCGASWMASSNLYVLIDVEEQEGLFDDDDLNNTGFLIMHKTPALTNPTDATKPVMLHDAIRTVETCLLAFQQGATTRFSEGIQRKLRKFLDSRYDLQAEEITAMNLAKEDTGTLDERSKT
ncbi:hypothetical protein G7046_g3957 [Stylonectria norvegica]|nr:hypothetical protein G7046_g3957 [Stylonectria norvegica]